MYRCEFELPNRTLFYSGSIGLIEELWMELSFFCCQNKISRIPCRCTFDKLEVYFIYIQEIVISWICHKKVQTGAQKWLWSRTNIWICSNRFTPVSIFLIPPLRLHTPFCEWSLNQLSIFRYFPITLVNRPTSMLDKSQRTSVILRISHNRFRHWSCITVRYQPGDY